VPGLATSFGTFFGILWFCGDRTVQLREMVIPIGASAIVSFVLWYFVTKLLDPPERLNV
jgi:hypothetical protein